MNLMTKTQVMQLVAAGKVHETFDHETDGKFDVTAMREWAERNKHLRWVLSVNIGDVLNDVRSSRVIDEARVDELPEASWRYDPAMFVVFETDGQQSHLLIDGTHRILRRHKEGFKSFTAYFIDAKHIIRPDMTQWVEGEKRGIDWGDKLEGDRIIKRTGDDNG